MRDIRPATNMTLDQIRHALKHLRDARDLLVGADAPQAATAVREAIKSAEGAERHAQHRLNRSKENG